MKLQQLAAGFAWSLLLAISRPRTDAHVLPVTMNKADAQGTSQQEESAAAEHAEPDAEPEPADNFFLKSLVDKLSQGGVASSAGSAERHDLAEVINQLVANKLTELQMPCHEVVHCQTWLSSDR